VGAARIAQVGDHRAAPWSRSDSATVSAGRGAQPNTPLAPVAGPHMPRTNR
jgi:hypothetical protein